MNKRADNTLAEILGPWVEPDWDSGLIARCRGAWFKSLSCVLPGGVSHVAGVIDGLLRGPYELDEVAGLDFRYYEMQWAA